MTTLKLIKIMSTDVADLIVEKNHIHYGQKDRDPLQNMRFFKKHATPHATCYRLRAQVYDMHCPRRFMESNVRVFVRDAAKVHSATTTGLYLYIHPYVFIHSGQWPVLPLRHGVSRKTSLIWTPKNPRVCHKKGDRSTLWGYLWQITYLNTCTIHSTVNVGSIIPFFVCSLCSSVPCTNPIVRVFSF
jgi:hypothetical protein